MNIKNIVIYYESPELIDELINMYIGVNPQFSKELLEIKNKKFDMPSKEDLVEEMRNVDSINEDLLYNYVHSKDKQGMCTVLSIPNKNVPYYAQNIDIKDVFSGEIMNIDGAEIHINDSYLSFLYRFICLNKSMYADLFSAVHKGTKNNICINSFRNLGNNITRLLTEKNGFVCVDKKLVSGVTI